MRFLLVGGAPICDAGKGEGGGESFSLKLLRLIDDFLAGSGTSGRSERSESPSPLSTSLREAGAANSCCGEVGGRLENFPAISGVHSAKMGKGSIVVIPWKDLLFSEFSSIGEETVT